MPFTVTIDWLSFTLKQDTKEARHVLTLLNPDGIMEPDNARFGYDRCARTKEGTFILTSDRNPGMGCHAIIPGSALRAYHEHGTPCTTILQAVISAKGKVTRLDVAKDAQDERFNLAEVAQMCSVGQFTGTAQKCATINSSDGGQTLYIGSRQSERFVRVYDKAVESGQPGDWKRLEMETKGEVARLIADAIVSGGFSLNTILCQSVKKMCNVQHTDWHRILTVDAEFALPKVEKSSDTEAWINSQVGSAIINHLDKNPNSPAVRRLYAMLKERLETGK